MADGSLSGVRGICTIGRLERTAYASPLKSTFVHYAASGDLGSKRTFAASALTPKTANFDRQKLLFTGRAWPGIAVAGRVLLGSDNLFKLP